MMSRFCRYVEKVFDFGPRMERLKDSRRRPRIPLGAIWGSVFFLFALRQRSLHAMEGQLRQPRRMERLIGQKKPSADRMGQVLSLIDPSQLRAMLSGINHQVGRNKGLKNNWPFRVGAIDGHEFFSLPPSLLSPMLAAASVDKRRGGRGILSPWGSFLSCRVPHRHPFGCGDVTTGGRRADGGSASFTSGGTILWPFLQGGFGRCPLL
jgi:hypothetical protein